MLGIEFRLNGKITGHKFKDQENKDKEHKIFQYADGTRLGITQTESVKESFKVLQINKKALGDKVNISKPDGMWIGILSYRAKCKKSHKFAVLL